MKAAFSYTTFDVALMLPKPKIFRVEESVVARANDDHFHDGNFFQCPSKTMHFPAKDDIKLGIPLSLLYQVDDGLRRKLRLRLNHALRRNVFLQRAR